MNDTKLLVFFVGLGLLFLFLVYFVTESPKRRRLIGTSLALAVTALSLVSIFNTSHRPDNYSVTFAPQSGELLTDAQRELATSTLTTELGNPELDPADDPFSVSASSNSVFFSRPGLDDDEVEAAVGKVSEALDASASITREPRPKTDLDLGIDLQGGSAFLVELGKSAGAGVVTDTMRQQAIAVFEKRLNAAGNKDLLIAPQGDNRILIQMPGVKPEEVAGIRTAIEQVAKLEFRMVHPNSKAELSRRTGPEDKVFVPGYVEMKFRERAGETEERGSLLVVNRPDITGDQVDRAGVSFGVNGYEVNLDLNAEGGDVFYELSKRFNERIAIIVDGEIISAPGFFSGKPIPGGNVLISGDFSQQEAEELASNLENPLEVKPQIVDERSVSATFGNETISQGLVAGAIGLGVVLVFIAIYYKFAGVVALCGLFINLAILLGALAAFDFTLTMPGIAGIVLTIGVAIDANVLIYERLREELKAGKALPSAINAAYDKAFSAILDANVTTLITATILFSVASGMVKGFAITLTIGIAASLFSALLVTRVAFMWLTKDGRGGALKALQFLSVVPEKTYDVLGKRKIAIFVSAVLLATTVATYITIKPLGIDFTGGQQLTIQSDDKITLESVDASLADISDIPWSTQAQASPSGQDFITVRTSYREDTTESGQSNAERLLDEVSKDTGVPIADIDSQFESVGPLVGKELLRSSLLALVLGLFGVFFYLTFRFEVSFAVGAIVALVHDVIIVLGLVVLLGEKLSLIHVGAFLTIAGYSINDTIIVFDRIREQLKSSRDDIKSLMNEAISQTLSRTMITSLTTLVVVVTLAIFGGPSLRDFSVTMSVGIIVGTYSSLFVAAPVVLWWSRRSGRNLRREVLDAELARQIDDSGLEKEAPGSTP